MKTTNRIIALIALATVFAFMTPPTRAADQTEVLPAGTKLSLVATSDGNPAPTFEWFKDGNKIAEGATLVIEALSQAEVGAYTVKATNVAGSSTSDRYILQVGTAPTKPTIRIIVEVNVTVTNASATPPKP